MSWEQLWLNYKAKENYGGRDFFKVITKKAGGVIIDCAADELVRAAQGFFGLTPSVEEHGADSGIILQITDNGKIAKAEGFRVYNKVGAVYVESPTDKGILYGVFALIRCVMLNVDLHYIDISESPDNPIRMINHWDDFNGNIERGYSGRSFFFKENDIIVNERTKDYARLMASIGINCSTVNNVNVKGVAAELVTEKHFDKLRQIAEIFAGYGIKMFLSLNWASPMKLGGLDTADPLDESVINWWKERVEAIYQNIPGFGGFLVKADSEGEPGPFTYGRDHAQGANMLANLVKPHGGIIIWRCFVYNCKQDWRDKVTDRAKAAYDNFSPLDGKFLDNVILQIKNGPMDFQVREPVTPLFGALKHTNQILEVQIAQEYTGHQKDVCYLVPSWKETLDFRTYMSQDHDTVGDIVSGKAFGGSNCGFAAVSNTGDEPNWTSNDLAAANLYGFGRLAWNTGLSSEEIAYEWTVLTLSNEPQVVKNVAYILLNSWPAYENYTSPLGIGWMINPGIHYGPNVDGYEYDVWGTYHRADHKGIGVDRSSKGTGYATQYNDPNRIMYETPDACPTELLLFFHRLSYDYVLKTGKTLIQHIYDSHFDGADAVEVMIKQWRECKEFLPLAVYERVMKKFDEQSLNSKNWRDTVNTYFYRKSMINDKHGRLIHT